MRKCVEVFCPATIANISCGFDVLGLCLENVGDEMIVKHSSDKKIKITVMGPDIPTDPNKNVAGVAVQALLQKLAVQEGFEIHIHKKIKAGSGIGSSAASSAGAVFAVNYLLGSPFSRQELVAFAAKGEKASCGSEHADNVAPALLGGFTLVRSVDPLDIISLPTPQDLFVSIIHPKIEVRTEDARAVLKRNISLQKAVTQWANLAAFVSAIHTQDYALMSRAMVDVVVEPERSVLIPYYHQTKTNAMGAGALGSGISGSGPSIFALSKGRDVAKKVLLAMRKTYENTGIEYDAHLSEIAKEGVYILKES